MSLLYCYSRQDLEIIVTLPERPNWPRTERLCVTPIDQCSFPIPKEKKNACFVQFLRSDRKKISLSDKQVDQRKLELICSVGDMFRQFVAQMAENKTRQSSVG